MQADANAVPWGLAATCYRYAAFLGNARLAPSALSIFVWTTETVVPRCPSAFSFQRGVELVGKRSDDASAEARLGGGHHSGVPTPSSLTDCFQSSPCNQ